jgi:hypothetical protein
VGGKLVEMLKPGEKRRWLLWEKYAFHLLLGDAWGLESGPHQMPKGSFKMPGRAAVTFFIVLVQTLLDKALRQRLQAGLFVGSSLNWPIGIRGWHREGDQPFVTVDLVACQVADVAGRWST